MSINKIEMQDSNGNALYPHTTGDLVNYDTTKTVNQKIDEAIANLTSLKAGLATAINNKTGSSLTSDSTLADITSKINQIVTLSSGTADANATAANILAGSTAYVKGNKVTGTMANQGTQTSSLNCGASYTIPAGYHNGSGKVTANSLASQTSATATAGQILSGQTAYVNGNKLTGSMPNNCGITKDSIGFTVNGTSIYLNTPEGYYDSASSIRYVDPNLVASNILQGKTICGVNGTATVQSMGGKQIFSKTVDTLTELENGIALPFVPSIILLNSREILYTRTYDFEPGGTYLFSSINNTQSGVSARISHYYSDSNTVFPASAIISLPATILAISK